MGGYNILVQKCYRLSTAVMSNKVGLHVKHYITNEQYKYLKIPASHKCKVKSLVDH